MKTTWNRHGESTSSYIRSYSSIPCTSFPSQSGSGKEITFRSSNKPYLKHVKSCSKGWRHLKQLADFMEVSTTPLRWKHFLKGKKWAEEYEQNGREERAQRTNVTRLDYLESGGTFVKKSYTTSAELKDALEEQRAQEINPPESTAQSKPTSKPLKFRLFVVEDLSRDVIELLGAHYDIEPAFFRDQIFDYTWYNTRDRWIDPPRLNITAKRQRWLQIRFATSRYFPTPKEFVQACEEVDSFNVYRRWENDLNNSGLWDANGAIVGVTRSRATCWLDNNAKEGAVGRSYMHFHYAIPLTE